MRHVAPPTDHEAEVSDAKSSILHARAMSGPAPQLMVVSRVRHPRRDEPARPNSRPPTAVRKVSAPALFHIPGRRRALRWKVVRCSTAREAVESFLDIRDPCAGISQLVPAV